MVPRGYLVGPYSVSVGLLQGAPTGTLQGYEVATVQSRFNPANGRTSVWKTSLGGVVLSAQPLHL